MSMRIATHQQMPISIRAAPHSHPQHPHPHSHSHSHASIRAAVIAALTAQSAAIAARAAVSRMHRVLHELEEQRRATKDAVRVAFAASQSAQRSSESANAAVIFACTGSMYNMCMRIAYDVEHLSSITSRQIRSDDYASSTPRSVAAAMHSTEVSVMNRSGCRAHRKPSVTGSALGARLRRCGKFIYSSCRPAVMRLVASAPVGLESQPEICFTPPATPTSVASELSQAI